MENDSTAKKDPRLAEINKGNSDIHKSAETHNLVQKMPNWRVQRFMLEKSPVVIAGPYNKITPSTSFGHAYATTISTYPQMKGKRSREGDPVCDSYRVHTHENGVIACIGDGCGWGELPKQASNRLKDNFVTYFTKNAGKVKTTKELGHHLLNALAIANFSIFYDKDDVWSAGTSTCLGGLLMEISPGEPGAPQFVFQFISVGDCKAFRYDCRAKKCSDITVGNRNNLSDPRDPGGRLGPQTKQGGPDLRNLELYACPCQVGDIIILCSDGVHDNLDPQILGKKPSDCELPGDDWAQIPNEIGMTAKNRFMNKLMTDIVLSEGSEVNPSVIAKKIIRHCRDITGAARQWMEQNPNSVQQADYVLYPGKLDHTTVVCFMVGHYDGSDATVTQKALDQQVWPFG
jgi:serine/threonine protein phosphatase PrpC